MTADEVEDRHGEAASRTPSWRAGATAWMDARLAEAGFERTGEPDTPRIRPWATVVSAPTTEGTVWLKAAAPATRFEVRVYPLLAEVAPDRVLVPLAVDTTRGWLLLPDGGPSLGETLSGEDRIAALEEALPRYGELQRDLVPKTEQMLAMGADDMRPATLLTRMEEALEACRRRSEDGEVVREVLGRLEDSREWVAESAEQLTSSVVAPSLDHNDLHAWNFLHGEHGVRFYDWGDAVIAHPFASLLIAPAMIGGEDTDPRSAVVLRIRDAYLEAFSDLAPRSELVETLELACRLAKIARCLTWERAVSGLRDEEVDGEWASAPFEALASLLDPSYLSPL